MYVRSKDLCVSEPIKGQLIEVNVDGGILVPRLRISLNDLACHATAILSRKSGCSSSKVLEFLLLAYF
jgi:hypothetical protein